MKNKTMFLVLVILAISLLAISPVSAATMKWYQGVPHTIQNEGSGSFVVGGANNNALWWGPGMTIDTYPGVDYPGSMYVWTGGDGGPGISYYKISDEKSISWEQKWSGVTYRNKFIYFSDGIGYVPLHGTYKGYLFYLSETKPEWLNETGGTIPVDFSYTPSLPWYASSEAPLLTAFESTYVHEDYTWEIGQQGSETPFYTMSGPTKYQTGYTFTSSGNYWVQLTGTNSSISGTSYKEFSILPTGSSGLYDISVSPDYVPADGSQKFSASVTSAGGDLDDINMVTWTWGLEEGSATNSFYDISNPSATLAFLKKEDGHYYQHDGSNFNIDCGTSLPNGHTIFPPGVIGEFYVRCVVNSATSGSQTIAVKRAIGFDLSGNPIESPDGLFFPNQVTLIVQDAFTSLRVYNPIISLYNTRVANWTNVTAPTGEQVFNVPIGDQIRVDVEVEGGLYRPWNITTIAAKDQIIYANLYYDQEILGNLTRLIVRAAVAPPAANSGTPIQGVQISVQNPANTTEMYYGVTDSAGKALFDVSPSTDYIVSAYGGTYIATSKPINTGTGNPYEVVMWMTTGTPTVTATPGGVTFTPTYTYVIPTVTPTGSATTLPGGGYGYSGFWGPIAEGLGGAGAEPGEMGILLASILIFAGFCIGGWSGAAYDPGAPFNGMGAISGGILGFVLSVAFGFIPIIWLVAIILISVFIYIFFRR